MDTSSDFIGGGEEFARLHRRPLRANKSETFDCLKFTLEGAGERCHGHARTSAWLFAFFA